MENKQVFKYLFLAALLGGGLSLGAYKAFFDKKPAITLVKDSSGVSRFTKGNPGDVTVDLTYASEKALAMVVHIKTTSTVQQRGFEGMEDPFEFFFGPQGGRPRRQPSEGFKQQGAGSGVIISSDGYIVTNNHVVEGSEELEVVLHDNKTYKAKIIGTDPSTDLAVIKISASNLPAVAFANSDEVKIGQWVLAVGNPFNLSNTVTAGIVSAKGRNINILQDKTPIEAFIQTDAAVNPGNSGGALVNVNGDLVGINTAIQSPTGSFAGYSFAIPSNIVAKVVEDLREFGVAQRAFLGVNIRNLEGDFAKEKGLSDVQGIYVEGVTAEGAASAAGIKKGDIIQKIDGQSVENSTALIERIGRKRPGDKVNVSVLRDGKLREILVPLKNKAGKLEVVKKGADNAIEVLGAEFENLDSKELEKEELSGGVRVKSIGDGKLKEMTDIKNGFIITRVNNRTVKSIDDIKRALDTQDGNGCMIEGKYPGQSGTRYYAFGLG
jgi:serine protease Do